MKPFLIVAIIASMAMHGAAQDFQLDETTIPTFEVGVIMGVPTGLSAKYWLNKRTALDAGAALNLFDDESVEFYGDYLFNIAAPEVQGGRLPLYVGLGPTFGVADEDFSFGGRVPVGAQYLVPNGRLTFFAEVAPIVEFVPDSDFEVSGGGGVRLTF
jgi:hypothetical protein